MEDQDQYYAMIRFTTAESKRLVDLGSIFKLKIDENYELVPDTYILLGSSFDRGLFNFTLDGSIVSNNKREVFRPTFKIDGDKVYEAEMNDFCIEAILFKTVGSTEEARDNDIKLIVELFGLDNIWNYLKKKNLLSK